MRQILLALLIAAPASAQNADALWQSLMDGNRAFVAGKVTFDHLADLRRHSADHQNPPFTILACSDSRVPPELIFNRSLDQLFVMRENAHGAPQTLVYFGLTYRFKVNHKDTLSVP